MSAVGSASARTKEDAGTVMMNFVLASSTNGVTCAAAAHSPFVVVPSTNVDMGIAPAIVTFCAPSAAPTGTVT